MSLNTGYPRAEHTRLAYSNSFSFLFWLFDSPTASTYECFTAKPNMANNQHNVFEVLQIFGKPINMNQLRPKTFTSINPQHAKKPTGMNAIIMPSTPQIAFRQIHFPNGQWTEAKIWNEYNDDLAGCIFAYRKHSCCWKQFNKCILLHIYICQLDLSSVVQPNISEWSH